MLCHIICEIPQSAQQPSESLKTHLFSAYSMFSTLGVSYVMRYTNLSYLLTYLAYLLWSCVFCLLLWHCWLGIWNVLWPVKNTSAAISNKCFLRDLWIKPGFHYPSWRPELTGDQFPLFVNTGHVSGRLVSTSRVDRPCWRVMETGHPSSRAINSGRQLG